MWWGLPVVWHLLLEYVVGFDHNLWLLGFECCKVCSTFSILTFLKLKGASLVDCCKWCLIHFTLEWFCQCCNFTKSWSDKSGLSTLGDPMFCVIFIWKSFTTDILCHVTIYTDDLQPLCFEASLSSIPRH